MYPSLRKSYLPRFIDTLISQNQKYAFGYEQRPQGTPHGYNWYEGRWEPSPTPVAPLQIPYTGKTGTFNIFDILTGQTSGATGSIITSPTDASGVVTVTSVAGSFQNGETVSNGSVSATVNGSVIYFTSGTMWGQIGPIEGSNYSTAGTIEIRKVYCLAHLKSGGWQTLQDPTYSMAGAYFPQDFVGGTDSATITDLGGGVFSIPKPAYNRLFHWWYNPRCSYTGNTIDHVYVEVEVRSQGGGGPLICQIGLDWWVNESAPYVNPVGTNNPVAGNNNWVTMTTEWVRAGCFFVPAKTFMADPPPLVLT